MQQPILEEAGHFNVTAVDTSTLAPEEGTSAFVWRVEAADKTLYVLQVALFCTTVIWHTLRFLPYCSYIAFIDRIPLRKKCFINSPSATVVHKVVFQHCFSRVWQRLWTWVSSPARQLPSLWQLSTEMAPLSLPLQPPSVSMEVAIAVHNLWTMIIWGSVIFCSRRSTLRSSQIWTNLNSGRSSTWISGACSHNVRVGPPTTEYATHYLSGCLRTKCPIIIGAALTGYLMDVFPKPIQLFPNDPCGVRTMYSIPKV